MTEPTPLDLAHADIVAANGADAEQRARMAWFLRLLDTQLFVLATDVSDDAPRIAEFALEEGHFKFRDYFASQGRPFARIGSVGEMTEESLYRGGNTIDLDRLAHAFPFA